MRPRDPAGKILCLLRGTLRVIESMQREPGSRQSRCGGQQAYTRAAPDKAGGRRRTQWLHEIEVGAEGEREGAREGARRGLRQRDVRQCRPGRMADQYRRGTRERIALLQVVRELLEVFAR